MSGKLYGPILSPNVARAALVARELGVIINYVPVDLSKGDHKRDPVIGIAPFGSVPAYESNDGMRLFESRAIGRYLDKVTGGKLLHLQNNATYGLVEAWASVESGNFAKFAEVIVGEKIMKPLFSNAVPDEAAVEAAITGLKAILVVYEKNLIKNLYLAGSELSIADLFHIPVAAAVFGQAFPNLLDEYPHVKEWFNRITSLSSWQSVQKDQQELLAIILGSKKQ